MFFSFFCPFCLHAQIIAIISFQTLLTNLKFQLFFKNFIPNPVTSCPPPPKYVSVPGSVGWIQPESTALYPKDTTLLHFSNFQQTVIGAGIAQSAWGRAGQPGFESWQSVQSGSGAHPASYPMVTRGSFTGGKTARA
jgi:hypothetical protein